MGFYDQEEDLFYIQEEWILIGISVHYINPLISRICTPEQIQAIFINSVGMLSYSYAGFSQFFSELWEIYFMNKSNPSGPLCDSCRNNLICRKCCCCVVSYARTTLLLDSVKHFPSCLSVCIDTLEAFALRQCLIFFVTLSNFWKT